MASNYTDKSIDLVAWHGVQPKGWAALSQALFNEEGKSEACTGIQLAVQRWLSLFLTPLGSITFNKDRGTSFMLKIYTMCTESDVYILFNMCNAKALAQLRNEEKDLKDDEKIESVTLDHLDLFLGNLSLYITLRTKAGENTQIILPIDTNPMAL